MADQNFLNTEIRPGSRVIFARLEMTREQILRRGEWLDKVPVVKTKNYVQTRTKGADTDIILVPNIRAKDNAAAASGPNGPNAKPPLISR